jgi:hypothetical protein
LERHGQRCHLSRRRSTPVIFPEEEEEEECSQKAPKKFLVTKGIRKILDEKVKCQLWISQNLDENRIKIG